MLILIAKKYSPPVVRSSEWVSDKVCGVFNYMLNACAVESFLDEPWINHTVRYNFLFWRQRIFSRILIRFHIRSRIRLQRRCSKFLVSTRFRFVSYCAYQREDEPQNNRRNDHDQTLWKVNFAPWKEKVDS